VRKSTVSILTGKLFWPLAAALGVASLATVWRATERDAAPSTKPQGQVPAEARYRRQATGLRQTAPPRAAGRVPQLAPPPDGRSARRTKGADGGLPQVRYSNGNAEQYQPTVAAPPQRGAPAAADARRPGAEGRERTEPDKRRRRNPPSARSRAEEQDGTRRQFPIDPPASPLSRGRVHLGAARLNFQSVDASMVTCDGRVTLVNDTSHTVTGWTLILGVGFGPELVPYESYGFGPTPVFSRSLLPHSQCSYPVMTTGAFIGSVYGTHTVSMEATLTGPPYAMTDQVMVY